MSERISLYVFLGNPGRQYEHTRHNAAWMLLDRLESRINPDWQNKFRGRYTRLQTPGKPAAYLYCSHGFMNKSGEGVKEIASFFSIDAGEILVIYDELDMEPGRWKISRGGGLKGHNGLRSVKQYLGSNDFSRCALGIGRPAHPGFEVNRWVLSAFSEGELADMNRAFDEAIAEIWEL